METWVDHFEYFQNWVRSASLVGICSYFEIYLKTLCLRTLQADALKGLSALNAVAFARNDSQLKTLLKKLKPLFNGSWVERIQEFQDQFAGVPAGLNPGNKTVSPVIPPDPLVVVMDGLRESRNRVGHSFGRNVDRDADPGLDIPSAPMVTVSEAELGKAFQAFQKAARAFDSFLSTPAHVGQAEPFVYCARRVAISALTARQLNKEIGEYAGRQPGMDYSNSLLDFCSLRPTQRERRDLRRQYRI
jgi:hypothetical protein